MQGRSLVAVELRGVGLEALVVAIIDHDEYGKPMPPELMKRAAESERGVHAGRRGVNSY